MKITYFTFRPDDHYGYAEIDQISEFDFKPLEEEDIIERWVNADCSWDHDEEEGTGEDCYRDWGYNDLYGNTYLMCHDAIVAADMINNSLRYFEGTENQASDEMMRELSSDGGVEFVMCIPSWSGKEISIINGAKNTSGNRKIDVEGGNVIEILGNLVSDEINKGDFEKAADKFLAMKKINGVADMIKSKITEEEYLKLEKITRGKGIVNRFGLY